MEVWLAAIGAGAALLGGLIPAWIKESLTSRREAQAAARAAAERADAERRESVRELAKILHKVADHYTVPSQMHSDQNAALVRFELTLQRGEGPIAHMVRRAREDQFDWHEHQPAPSDVALERLLEWLRGEITADAALQSYDRWISRLVGAAERDPGSVHEQ